MDALAGDRNEAFRVGWQLGIGVGERKMMPKNRLRRAVETRRLPGRKLVQLVVGPWLMSIVWLAMGGISSGLEAEQPRPPNILLIFSDDQGWHDVGCYGSEIPTPHIDSLARDGLKLTQFYAASSICTPSRYGLLTGRYPSRSHDQLLGALMFLSEADAARGLRPNETTYVERLRQAGYATALVGKWHLGHGQAMFWPTEHGFDSFFGHTGGCVDYFSLHYAQRPDWYRGRQLIEPGMYATDAITAEAIRFLDRTVGTAQPFYLHIAYNAPHFGKAVDPSSGEPLNTMQPKQADLERVPATITEPTRRAFAAKVMGMDAGIGEILAHLDRLQLAEDTLVVFMTDHGGDPNYGGSNLPLRGGKATLFEGGLRVPCVWRWPGKIAAGSTSDAVVCAIDCFPTFCRLAGCEPARSGIDGLDISDVLWGRAAASPRELFWQTGSHAELNRSSWVALRQGDWKLIEPPGEPALLFNLRDDPHEEHDLAEQQPDVRRRLRARAREWTAGAEGQLW